MSIETGGAAFPMHVHIQTENLDNLPEIYGADQEGMTLRDWFAGQALAGIRSSASNANMLEAYERTGEQHGLDINGAIAMDCYQMADAMLKARGES